MYTEEEAKKKWCPMARRAMQDEGTYNRLGDGGPSVSCRCIVSKCMMWRWLPENTSGGEWVDTHRIGYCGLAGKP